MPPAPSPAPDPDDPEPAGSRPVPADGNDGAPEPPEASGFPPPGDDEDDSADYLGELMAAAAAGEDLTAQDIAGAGFGEDGTAHQLRPGPVLATLVHAATTDEKILATLSDDDLVGIITAVRRIGSFAAWAEMTAIREFATRPDGRRPLRFPCRFPLRFRSWRRRRRPRPRLREGRPRSQRGRRGPAGAPGGAGVRGRRAGP